MQLKERGYTLIELVVVVAIIAIIAGIAISTFRDSSRDALRGRAQADLAALNDAVGRQYQTAYTYDGLDDVDALRAAAGLTLTEAYDFSVVVGADGQTYSARAVPAAGGEMDGDGAMAINEVGRRCYFPYDDSPNFANCPTSF